VSHYGLAIYVIIKKDLNAKRRIMELISSFNTSQNMPSFKDPLHNIKTDLLLLPRGPKSLKLLYSIMNLNTISLPGLGWMIPIRISAIPVSCRLKVH
jgi:hypothetical protein